MLILMEEFDGEPTPTRANDALYDKLYATVGVRPRLATHEETRPVMLRLVETRDGLPNCRAPIETVRRSA